MKNVKRIAALLLALVMVFALCACSDSGSGKDKDKDIHPIRLGKVKMHDAGDFFFGSIGTSRVF